MQHIAPYDRADYRYPQSVEAEIVASMGGRVYGPYTGRFFLSVKETDIEHIVAVSEAHDSGLCAAGPAERRRFARRPAQPHPRSTRGDPAGGNPFRIPQDGTRAEVIARYRADLWRRIRSGEIALEDLADLHAATHYLCWCRPLPCHGDVLARAAKWAASRLGRTQ